MSRANSKANLEERVEKLVRRRMKELKAEQFRSSETKEATKSSKEGSIRTASVTEDYVAEGELELSVEEGDLVTVKNSKRSDFWYVQDDSGRKGYVPAAVLKEFAGDERRIRRKFKKEIPVQKEENQGQDVRELFEFSDEDGKVKEAANVNRSNSLEEADLEAINRLLLEDSKIDSNVSYSATLCLLNDSCSIRVRFLFRCSTTARSQSAASCPK